MDPFLLYLIAVNAVTFLAFALDFFLCTRFPRLEDCAANALVLDVFPLAGGALGMLVALFVFTGQLPGRRMNKGNIAWWFLAIACLIVWSLVTCVVLGLVRLDAGGEGLLAGWNLDHLKILGIYLAVVNVVTAVAFVWDKHVAASGNDHAKRVPEARLLALSLVGGSVGGLIAMRAVRHKTKKWYFVWGLPTFLLLDAALVVFAHLAGLF